MSVMASASEARRNETSLWLQALFWRGDGCPGNTNKTYTSMNYYYCFFFPFPFAASFWGVWSVIHACIASHLAGMGIGMRVDFFFSPSK